jgi:hypothetical protein
MMACLDLLAEKRQIFEEDELNSGIERYLLSKYFF